MAADSIMLRTVNRRTALSWGARAGAGQRCVLGNSFPARDSAPSNAARVPSSNAEQNAPWGPCGSSWSNELRRRAHGRSCCVRRFFSSWSSEDGRAGLCQHDVRGGARRVVGRWLKYVEGWSSGGEVVGRPALVVAPPAPLLPSAQQNSSSVRPCRAAPSSILQARGWPYDVCLRRRGGLGALNCLGIVAWSGPHRDEAPARAKSTERARNSSLPAKRETSMRRTSPTKLNHRSLSLSSEE